jgi:rod shape-determining protein MreC
MAPPSPRRPGFSRRAQYGIFVSYVIAVAGIAVALLLALTARFDPQGHAALQGLLSEITTPVARAGRTVMGWTGGAGESVSAYFDAASKNEAMSKELAAARRKLIDADVKAIENRRLRALMGIAEKDGRPIVAARLVASSAASSRRYATLDAGRNQGVEVGQPVRGPEGLIGRIVRVGASTSSVLLIVDGGNIVPIKRAKDNVPALAAGIGDGRLDIRSLATGNNPFRVGDVFVSSGSGGIYPPGVPVAVITKHGRHGTVARPIADPSLLDYAFVLPVYVAVPDADRQLSGEAAP